MSKEYIKFHKDAFVSGELYARKGEIKEIDDSKGSATRWLKRGHEEVEAPKPEKKVLKKKASKKKKVDAEDKKEDSDKLVEDAK